VASTSGEICVNTLKKDWNPSNWSLSHIFEVVKCLLIVPFPESSLNEEAGREFMEDYQEFFSHAKLYTGVHAKPNQTQLKMIE
jgi:ubiquitin-conjugating enzyme E2 S